MFIDPRFRQERIFMVFVVPALLIVTALVFLFLFLKKDREAAAEITRPPSLDAAPSRSTP